MENKALKQLFETISKRNKDLSNEADALRSELEQLKIEKAQAKPQIASRPASEIFLLHDFIAKFMRESNISISKTHLFFSTLTEEDTDRVISVIEPVF